MHLIISLQISTRNELYLISKRKYKFHEQTILDHDIISNFLRHDD